MTLKGNHIIEETVHFLLGLAITRPVLANWTEGEDSLLKQKLVHLISTLFECIVFV